MFRTFLRCSAIILFLALLVDPTIARSPAAQPSFECRYARTPTERAICASADLAGADRRIARRYRALQALPEPARAALAQDQAYFLGVRDRTFEAAEPDTAEQRLLGAMLMRADVLERIETAAVRDLTGRWASFEGEFTLASDGKGRLRFHGGATEQVDARWTCAFAGSAAISSEVLRFGDPEEPDWRMTIRREGPTLVLAETNAAGEERDSPFCGLNGRMEGTYFRVRGDPFDGDADR